MKKVYYTPYTDAVEQFLFNHINKHIENDENYKVLHLTPTLILYRKRKGDYQKRFRRFAQKLKLKEEAFHKHIILNEFHHWTKDFVYKEKRERPLSRSECHIIVKRSIKEILPDQREWMSVSYQILDLFLYLNTSHLSNEDLKEISPYSDWGTIVEIYHKYNSILKAEGVEDYSQCLLRILDEEISLSAFSEVIFDGPFLFFDPIQEALMNKFISMGKSVKFIVPFDRNEMKVNPAYKVIQRIYSCYVPEEDWEKINLQKGNSFYLERIPESIFTENTTNYDGSLDINRYPSIEQELNDVVSRIKKLTQVESVSFNKIAIVTPNSKEIRPIIREISENLGLKVEVPERSFLGLSIGEFIRLIYLIKNDERKFEKDSYLDSSMFKRILDSRWIQNTHSTISSFQLVEDVFFSDIISLDQWKDQLTKLQSIKQSLSKVQFPYHPIHPVSMDDIQCWKKVIEEIKGVQDQVFSIEGQSIANHAKNLLTILEPLIEESEWKDDSSFADDAEELILRLRGILEGVSTQDRIKMDAAEFGDILLGLFDEHEEEADEAKKESMDDFSSKGIMVTSLQNIVYQNYKYIFPVEFTQENFPKPEKAEWPLFTDIMSKLLSKTTSLKVHSTLDFERLISDREKYYFYLSFYSAADGYHISYSKSKNGETQYPSHYLHDFAKTIGIEEENVLEDTNKKPKSLERLLQDHGILKFVDFYHDVKEVSNDVETGTAAIRIPEKLSIDELGIYRICPKRFEYMQKYPQNNVYSSQFQLSFYIGTELFIDGSRGMIQELADQKLVEVFENSKVRGKMLTYIPLLINKNSQVFDFFPVSEETKESAIFTGRLFLESLINQFFPAELINNLKKKGMAHAGVALEANEIKGELEVQTDKKKYKVNATREISFQLGFKPKRTFSFSHRPHLLGSSNYDIEIPEANKQRKVVEWLAKVKREFFYKDRMEFVQGAIQEIITDMETSTFPKQKGTHCSYCPFIKGCLENQSLTDDFTLHEEGEIGANG
jgi:hypothetical protein